MSEGRSFSLGAILAVTHGCLLCEMSEVYDILNYLTGENLMTHQLPRAAKTAGPDLLRQFPDLLHIDVSGITPKNVRRRMAALMKHYGATRSVAPLPPHLYESRDPISELIEIRGGSVGIIVVTVDE